MRGKERRFNFFLRAVKRAPGDGHTGTDRTGINLEPHFEGKLSNWRSSEMGSVVGLAGR